MWFIYFIAVIIWGVIWGYVAQTVNESKGYDGGFWLGFFLGFIGLIIVACKAECHSSVETLDSTSSLLKTIEDQKTVSTGDWKCICGCVNSDYVGTCSCGRTRDESSTTYENLVKASEDECNKRILAHGGWKCICGRVNSDYVGTCSCGRTKNENSETQETPIQRATEKEDKELLNLQKLKSYKELLDFGIISKEEFDKKKSELLNI